MITVEAWTSIRYLHAQGKSIRAIARELSVTRNTVRAALRQERPPRYIRPKRPNPKLAPFAEEIQRMYFEQHLIGSRIFRELRARGYTGGQTALYTHLQALKALVPNPKLTERFETAPGQQGQFDWSPYTVLIGETLVRVVVYGLVLGYSRRPCYWPSLDETQSSVFEALEAGLQHFGGSPKELLVDNAKALVTDANPQHFRWNPHFLELCGHYGIQPVACQPGRPRTKGKVERPFFYLEQHFIKGNRWPSFPAFSQALAAFTAQELDQRVHATTQEPPLARFAREQALLTPLPVQPFISSREALRKVSWDCLVSWAGSRYSVPWSSAGQPVWLRVSQGRALTIRDQQGQELARHELAARKGTTVIEPDHYQGLRSGMPQTRVLLTRVFQERFPDQAWFAEELLRQQPHDGVRQLRAILALTEVYPAAAVQAAFEAARTYQGYSQRFIRGILEAGGIARLAAPPSAATPVSVVADLGPYQRILEAGR